MGTNKAATNSLTENEIRALLQEAEAECAGLKEKLAVFESFRNDPRRQYLPMAAEDMEITMLSLAQRQSAGGVAHLGLVDAPSALEMAGITLDEDESEE